MANTGYDVVVDVDDDVREIYQLPLHANPNPAPFLIVIQGDLGRTDLQDDLEFHNSSFSEATTGARKPGSSPGLPPPVTASSSSGGKRMLWTIGFYAQFFDVDTTAVLSRCWAALFPRANFLDVLEGNPDLYGPFWIATTVVLILFLGGTISDWVSHDQDVPFAYNFKLLSGTPANTILLKIIPFIARPTSNDNLRRRRPYLRLHPLCPRCALCRSPLFRLRGRQPPRMLGPLRLRKPHLGARSPDQLVADRHTQLDLRRHRLRYEHQLSPAEPIPRAQRHGAANKQGTSDNCGSAASRPIPDCQIPVLCA